MERFTEHRAPSFNDAGLWGKLLEKAKKGTTTETYFVADIVDGSLQTSMFAKLGLPAEFLEHHRRNLTENIILEGPDGRKWPVMLGLSWDSKPCLLHGWREFATDCNLAVNDNVLFFLWEDSHFLVQVFDSNHNIKRRGGGTSDHIGRTTLPQVTEPIQSFGFKATRPNIFSLPSRSNNSEVAKNVHRENHTTQASPSGVKLAFQEPGVEEDDDPVADVHANFGELLESFPDPESALSSDAEVDPGLNMKRARNLNRKTKGRGGGELHKLTFDPPGSNWTIFDYLKEASAQETAEATVRKEKEPKQASEEKIPEKSARKAPTDRSKALSASSSRKRQAFPRGMRKTSPDDPDSRATKSAPAESNKLKVGRWRGRAAAVAAKAAEAREGAKAAANKEGEATAPAPASDPVTPMPVEAPKQAFKRPKPRNPSPSQLYFSKRRPVTQQERQAALDAGQRYAVDSYNRTYVMQLRVSQVYCGFRLAGTLDFAEAMELPLQGLKQITLFDVTGRKWEAVWHGEHPKRSGLSSDGWTRFVLDHYLEEGDVCVFELPDPKVCNIAVTVFPVVPLTETPKPSGWRDHYTVEEPVVPAVVPPEADFDLDLATLGQSSSFEKEDSGMEGKRRRLSIDKNSGEEEMNKSCEKVKSSEEDKSREKGKSCMEEPRTERISEEKSVEEKRLEEQFCREETIVEEKICEEEEVQEDLT